VGKKKRAVVKRPLGIQGGGNTFRGDFHRRKRKTLANDGHGKEGC